MNCACISLPFSTSQDQDLILYIRESRHYCLWNTYHFFSHTGLHHSHISDVDLGWLSRSSAINHHTGCVSWPVPRGRQPIYFRALLLHGVTKPTGASWPVNTKYNLLPFLNYHCSLITL